MCTCDVFISASLYFRDKRGWGNYNKQVREYGVASPSVVKKVLPKVPAMSSSTLAYYADNQYDSFLRDIPDPVDRTPGELSLFFLFFQLTNSASRLLSVGCQSAPAHWSYRQTLYSTFILGWLMLSPGAHLDPLESH